MVATIFALRSASAAASYYEGDDYYSEGGKSPSTWYGKGAEEQGLTGEVDRDVFVGALEGVTADGQQLGTIREGELQHRPGWDMTFSAPKSVSIMAEIGGDRRLLDAHDAAVRAALDHVEEYGVASRVRAGGKVDTVSTGNLAAAVFRHNTSRELDPQLHSHAVILNMTKTSDGNWRSLESREMYRLYMSVGAVYRQHLAAEAERLGYGVERGKDSLFELKGVSRALISAFSTRSAQITKKLADQGKTRDTATAQQKSVIALDTRERKQDVDRGQLVEQWRAKAAELGFGEIKRKAAIIAATRAAGAGRTPLAMGKATAVASAAVASAARSLSERQSVISASQLAIHAGHYALGKATPAEIRQAVGEAVRGGELEARRFRDNRGIESKGFVTRESINIERRMLASEGRGRGSNDPVLPRIAAARQVAHAVLTSRDHGHKWTRGQKEAASGLLLTTNRVAGIQGYAGTAKTTTVLATYANTMHHQGFRVRAFAPTASAAELLGEAIAKPGAGTESRTIASLVQNGYGVVEEARKGPMEAWIVDEASMVSAKDMTRVLDLAERANARLVLVGDVKQLGSVEAGRAFGQLQDAGMQVWKLDEIVRQDNVKTREAVMATIAGDGRRALEALDRGGGAVIEKGEADDRIGQLARDFAALSRDERNQTLVLDPSREGRERLTDAIRSELVKDGSLGRKSILVVTYEARGLTREEARHAHNYQVGDAVTFRRDYRKQGVEKNQGYIVQSIDAERNRIRLADPDGRKVEWRLDKWGRGQAETFAQVEREIRTGDRLQFTRNDRERGRTNGRGVDVVNIDTERKMLLVRDAKGEERTINLFDRSDRHFRHGWVNTIHSTQGATARRVLAHLESFRANTVNAKSAYVAISRAKTEAVVYTDSREALSSAISGRSGENQSALNSDAQPKKGIMDRLSGWMDRLSETLTGINNPASEATKARERSAGFALG